MALIEVLSALGAMPGVDKLARSLLFKRSAGSEFSYRSFGSSQSAHIRPEIGLHFALMMA